MLLAAPTEFVLSKVMSLLHSNRKKNIKTSFRVFTLFILHKFSPQQQHFILNLGRVSITKSISSEGRSKLLQFNTFLNLICELNLLINYYPINLVNNYFYYLIQFIIMNFRHISFSVISLTCNIVDRNISDFNRFLELSWLPLFIPLEDTKLSLVMLTTN